MKLMGRVPVGEYVRLPSGIVLVGRNGPHRTYGYSQNGWHVEAGIPLDAAGDICLQAQGTKFVISQVGSHGFSRFEEGAKFVRSWAEKALPEKIANFKKNFGREVGYFGKEFVPTHFGHRRIYNATIGTYAVERLNSVVETETCAVWSDALNARIAEVRRRLKTDPAFAAEQHAVLSAEGTTIKLEMIKEVGEMKNLLERLISGISKGTVSSETLVAYNNIVSDSYHARRSFIAKVRKNFTPPKKRKK